MMQQDLTLTIATDEEKRRAELRLSDASGGQLACRSVDFTEIPEGTRNALFDLRKYLRYYVDPPLHEQEMGKVGVAIAERVLGKDIFVRLWQSESSRTLTIVLPQAGAEANELAIGMARIPWEIARPAMGKETLAERNLRLVHQVAGREPASHALPLQDGEELRVLFVFAEARGTHPLGMRQERRLLIDLFEQKIYPQRKVRAHFLGHGVTRAQLLEQVQAHNGYHVVHWSGHGATNTLLLCEPGGKEDRISGEELIGIFKKAGGHLPRLFVLSACHSGNVGDSITWNEFLARARGLSMLLRESLPKDLEFVREPSFAGTAHALLQGGVPAVVAMRFAVGDDYARELALLLYRFLLADPGTKAIDEALTLARTELMQPDKSGRFSVGDHATPLLYGAEPPFRLASGRSSALADGRRRRLQDVGELRMAQHPGFVGRTWELASLGSDFIATGEKPIAQIVGLGGMGKTALAAEVLDLWEDRFDWVLIYQGKPNALAFDATLRDIHLDLLGEKGIYAEHVREHRADAIWQDATPDFQGDRRQRRMVANLVRALGHEKILLVFDNFESALKPHSENDAAEVWACKDPAWDFCFAALAERLRGKGSRVLVTTRYPLASLVDGAHLAVLGPLPAGEAELFVRQHPVLSHMLFGDDSESALVYRILHASRFNPLLMDRLAKLAGSAELRPQLLAALEALEKKQGYSDLPDLFSAAGGAIKERVYLRDALESSLDLLLHEAGPDARRLLWMISLMNQPETLSLLRSVWAGDSAEMAQIRELEVMLDNELLLPPELQQQLPPLPEEIQKLLATLPPKRDDLDPLMRRLVGTGLVTEERDSAEDDDPDLACHELVRERIGVFMEQHSHELGEITADAVRLAYADHLAATFVLHQDSSRALAAGSRALVYCVDAQAWDRLGDFAGEVVTTNSSPQFFAALLPHLLKAAEAAPEGQPRWRCKTYLADALRLGGRADASLPFYEEAANAARLVADAGGEGAAQALVDLATITGNWANAFGDVGQLPAAHERLLESAEASRQAGRPAVYVLGSELEAARIAVMLGQAAEVLGTIEAGLEQVASWWRRHRAGEKVAEAPNGELLDRALVSALDIAMNAHVALEDWAAALGRIDSILEVKQQLGRPAEDLATRINRANMLVELGRFGEAKAELEACLQTFAGDRALTAKTLSSLAALMDEQGDVAQSIVQERRALGIGEHLPNPRDRAVFHNNLANYLERRGQAADLAESRQHQLAALVYFLVTGLGQHLETSMNNYGIRFRQARDAGQELEVPRLAELLADSAFVPVREWLVLCGVGVEEVQAAVDDFLGQVREVALASEG